MLRTTRVNPPGSERIDGRRAWEPERRWARSPGESWFRPAPTVSDRCLIRASRAVGTQVFNAAGRRIGRIAEVVVDEASGRVAFALLACGGFFGLGARLCRTPWARLRYAPQRGGFVLAPYDPIDPAAPAV